MATAPLRAAFPSGPLTDSDGSLSPAWRGFFQSLYARTGNANGIASSDITVLEAELDAERDARIAADLALTAGLAAERTARQGADSNEAATRAASDTIEKNARTAADAGIYNRLATDQINVRDYGAVLDGVTNDHAAFQGAYTAATSAPGNPSIWVPRGGLGPIGTLTPAVSGAPVLWKLDGDTFGTGTTPVSVLGDGDVTQSYYGRVSFRKQLINSNNGFATAEVTLDNHNPALAGNALVSAFRVSTTMRYGSGGWTNPAVVTSARYGAAANSTSLCLSQQIDYSGSAPAVGQSDGGWLVWQTANGPEDASTGYDPSQGARSLLTFWPFALQMQDVWQATTAYALGDVIQPTIANLQTYNCIVAGTSGSTEPTWPTIAGTTVVDGTITWQTGIPTGLHPWQPSTHYAAGVAIQPTIPNGFTYVCTVAGTTSTTEPTWPVSAGSVTDGGATWAYGTTVAMQVSRAMTVGGGASSQFGTALHTSGTFYDAILELSGATLADGGVSDAAIRIHANHPIDLSGNLTSAGQNQHTLVYRSATQRLYYTVAGVDMWSVDASGNVRARGTVTPSTTP